jgi:Domain of unknown function (DUF1995)
MPSPKFYLTLTVFFSIQLFSGAFTNPVPSLNCKILSKTSLFSSTEQDEAQRLIEMAKKLREEIAAMEGKSVEEVEGEARKKKEDESLRREEQQLKRKEERKNAPRDDGRFLEVPSTSEDMVRQAARAVERAFEAGITRQTVRFALIREDQYVNEMNEWPGGAQQMAREAAQPLTRSLLKQVHAPTKKGEQADLRLPPTIKEQDIWDFDGSSLITAEAKAGANGDVQALVLPNTDVKYINDIAAIDEAMGQRLFLLINPFWRDLSSWGINLLAPGAKKKAQEVIFDKGYNETYSLLRFSCRGEECVALKAYPYDWQLYAYREDENNYIGGIPMETAIRLGSCKGEPSSEYVTQLLNERPESPNNII